MEIRDLLLTAFDNVEEAVRGALDGIDPELLNARVDPEANTIAWLVWHLTRVQDDHVSEVAGTEQAYTANGWAERFGLPFDVGAIGYGFSSQDVARTRITDPQLLIDHHADVHARTAEFVRGLSPADLDRIVDERWDPPVTLGVRLVSVITDDLQHAGQAALLRGTLERR
ncbi:mycothiol transferase [Modestobacter italicus]|uniref:mycothiol transferase n=1 Tax=Modestobacter italicus (strain DSM 44449 / CECT 9708 / BC 501) TaxID=2732864 RepID=UPI001C9593EA|nr:DinB family protein [Modestobacter italicus]